MTEQKVLATVHGRNITEADLTDLLTRLDKQTAERFQSEEGKKQLLDELVKQELMLLDALNKGYDKDPEFLNEMEKVRISLLKQYAAGRALTGVEVSEADAQKYFEENSDEFLNSEEINACHVLVTTKEEADMVCSEIEAGKSFEDAATEHSTCPSAEKGGDLGWFGKGMMVPEFETAAFELEVDEVSCPVESQFGWHVIKLAGKKESAKMEFDEVKGEIIKKLHAERQEKVFTDYMNSLTGQYEVKYL